MQILTLIVQNAFPNRIVGTATAASNYFRQVGATLGSAVVGSVFASRLTTLIAREARGQRRRERRRPATRSRPPSVNALPDALRLPILDAYNEALMPIFVFMVPLAADLRRRARVPQAEGAGHERPGRRRRRRPRRGAAAGRRPGPLGAGRRHRHRSAVTQAAPAVVRTTAGAAMLGVGGAAARHPRPGRQLT